MEEAGVSNPKTEGKKNFPTKKDTYVTFLGSQPAKVKKAVLYVLNATVPAVPSIWTGRKWQSHLTAMIICLSYTSEENTP